MFSFIALERVDAPNEQRSNLEMILQGIEDYFQQKNINWSTSSREDQFDSGHDRNSMTMRTNSSATQAQQEQLGKLLQLAIRQTVGVALRSQKAAQFIEQLMSLDEAHQECLEVIVKECLGSIDDGGASFRSKQSSIMDVQSIDSDYLESGNGYAGYGDN